MYVYICTRFCTIRGMTAMAFPFFFRLFAVFHSSPTNEYSFYTTGVFGRSDKLSLSLSACVRRVHNTRARLLSRTL